MDKPINKKLDQVLEGYKPIPMRSRMFYPRGFKLSDDFVNSFHQEYDRLVGEGLNPKNLLDRFGKALKFHVNETRRYKAPVVEDSNPNDRAIKVSDTGPGKPSPFKKKGLSHEEEADKKAKDKSYVASWEKKGGGDSGITQS